MRVTQVDAVRLGELLSLQARNQRWVCVGKEPHGHVEPPIRSGRPTCSCGANSFVRIDEAIRRMESGLGLHGPRAV